MPCECAALIGKDDEVLLWHKPQLSTATYIPDSASLWRSIWAHRDVITGVAHTHPCADAAWPSATDLSTFDALELGLGRKLTWWIVTLAEVVTVQRAEDLRQGWVVSASLTDIPRWVTALRTLSVEIPDEAVA